MPEKPTSNIDAEQGKIQGLVENTEAPAKLKEKLSKQEYQQVFLSSVDEMQKDFETMRKDINDQEVSAYIDAAQDEISNMLRLMVETGSRIISLTKEKESSSRRLSGSYAGLESERDNIKEKISSIKGEIAKFRQLAKIQSDLKAIDQNPSQNDKPKSQDEQITEKQTKLNQLNALKIKFLPQLSTGATKKFYDQIELELTNSLTKNETELQVLTLKNHPNQFGALIKNEARKTLAERCKTPSLLEKNIKDFNDKIQPYLDEISKFDRNNEKSVADAQKNIDTKVKESLQAMPFDRIKLQAGGRIFECQFNPPATDFESKKADAQSAAENYVEYMKQYPVANWTETMSFLNGIIKLKLVSKTEEKDPQNNGEYQEVVFHENSVDEQFSSKLLDEKQKEYESFEKAFDAWQASATFDDFIYGKPPVKIIRKIDLLKNHADRDDITLDQMVERLSHRMPELYKSLTKLPNGQSIEIQTKSITYDKKDGKKYVKQREVSNHSIIHPDRETSDLREYNSENTLLRETMKHYVETNEQLRHETIINEYYGDKDKPQIKKKQTLEDGVIMSSAEYNPEGKMVKKEIGVRGCMGVLAVEYADGKPLDEKTEYSRKMEFNDKEGKKIVITSFPDAQKENPNLTVDQYLHFLADTLKTDELKHAFINLMFQYTLDSPDFNDPLKKGTDKVNGDYWQTAQETALRTEKGLMLGDCDDYAFFMQKVLEYQGKSAYVMDMRDAKGVTSFAHFEAVTLEKDAKGRYHAKSYGTFGVDVNGVTIGAEPSGWEEDGYETKAGALRAIQQKWHRAYNLSLFFEDYIGEDKTIISVYSGAGPNIGQIQNKSKNQYYVNQRIPVGELKATDK